MKKILFVLSFFLIGCSSVQKNVTVFKIDKKEPIAVLPFKNFSQTPYAGIKASLIAEGVLRSKGFKVIQAYVIKNDKITKKNINSNYILSGKVIEWRYKTGIDAQPVVSLYIQIKNKKGRVVYSGLVSKSDLGNKSLGICAEEALEDIF